MNPLRLLRTAALALLLVLPGAIGFTQDVAYQYQTAPPVYAPGPAELDQLLAPVALYPDSLLGDILAASTYPLEVVALARWLERNPGLAGADLEQAVARQPWDGSVKSLAPFRNVVSMMNGELDWMQRLGNAVLADQAGVMEAVQRLRRKAREAGTLAANEHERVRDEASVIFIEPAQEGTVYVPYYDPRVVYGPWWWPDHPPYVWGAWYAGPWDYYWGGIPFWGVWVWGGWHEGHPHPDWHGNRLVHRHPSAPHVWNHDPAHRIGVPYADNRTSQIYRPSDRSQVQGRQGFRGFDVRPGVQPPSGHGVVRPGVQPPAGNPIARSPQPAQSAPPQRFTQPNALAPVPNPIAREQSARGHDSLASRPGGNPIARAPGGTGSSTGSGASRSSGGGISRGGGGHK
ncbi:MAG TPA: DUF3300 domain-containing protein [Usitatibacter sp.]|nr:DUF3300 domain-containing protein [Usitatibacter sp.]